MSPGIGAGRSCCILDTGWVANSFMEGVPRGSWQQGFSQLWAQQSLVASAELCTTAARCHCATSHRGTLSCNSALPSSAPSLFATQVYAPQSEAGDSMTDLAASHAVATGQQDGFDIRPSAPPAAAPTVLYGGPRPSDPLMNAKDKNKCRVRTLTTVRPSLVK